MVQRVSAYDEVASLIVGSDPSKVGAYKPSKSNQQRLEFLLDKNKGEGLSEPEKKELEQFLLKIELLDLLKQKP